MILTTLWFYSLRLIITEIFSKYLWFGNFFTINILYYIILPAFLFYFCTKLASLKKSVTLQPRKMHWKSLHQDIQVSRCLQITLTLWPTNEQRHVRETIDLAASVWGWHAWTNCCRDCNKWGGVSVLPRHHSVIGWRLEDPLGSIRAPGNVFDGEGYRFKRASQNKSVQRASCEKRK